MIDRLDAEIISKLAENARIGIAELASELGVSRTTVQLRLRKLEDDGVLLGFQPIVNLSKMGAPVEALITLEIDQRSEEHTSDLQSLMRISYDVFCLKKKNSKY